MAKFLVVFLCVLFAIPTASSKSVKFSGTVMFIGDSTMAAYAFPDDRPSTLVSRRMSINVDNLGEGGTGTTDMVKTLKTTLANSSALIVVSNYGINDAGFISEDKFAENLTFFVKTVRDSGKIPVLEEPNPVCNAPDAASRLDRYVSVIRNVAAKLKVPLIRQYDEIKRLNGWQSMTMDCIHPKGELYRFKAKNEIKQLRSILKTARNHSGSGKPSRMKAGSDL